MQRSKYRLASLQIMQCFEDKTLYCAENKSLIIICVKKKKKKLLFYCLSIYFSWLIECIAMFLEFSKNVGRGMFSKEPVTFHVYTRFKQYDHVSRLRFAVLSIHCFASVLKTKLFQRLCFPF